MDDYVYKNVGRVDAIEPYIAHFRLHDFRVKEVLHSELDFWMINDRLGSTHRNGIYSKFIELRNAVDDIRRKATNPNIVIMGNMNFDCDYINETTINEIRSLLNYFTFYIDDGVATTINQPLGPYSYQQGQYIMVSSSSGPYLYDKDLKIDQEKVNHIYN